MTTPKISNQVTVALAKGRLAEQAIAILEKCGMDLSPLKAETRKLILFDTAGKYRFVFVKPADVPTYVERGAADVGVVGKDTLLEENKDVYEPIDLKIGACKICVAGYPGFSAAGLGRNLRVATKYVRVAKDYYHKKGIDVDIIHLSGSVELGPVIGLADVIVDIVESGKTLKANGLAVLETLCASSARLIVNKVSLKTKKEEIEPLIEKVKKAVDM